MAHCEFEPALKWDCVKSVIEIVRAGKAGNGEAAMAIEHACCFGGSAAALYLSLTPDGVPDDIFKSPMRSTENETLESLCKALEDSCPDGECDADGKPLNATAIDWKTVFNNVLPLLWALVQRFIAGL